MIDLIQPEALGEGIERSLHEIGFNVEAFYYNHSLGARVRAKIFRNKVLLAKDVERAFNQLITSLLLNNNERNSKALIIIGGERLSEANKELLKNHSVPIIFWLIDSVDRFPQRMDTAQFANILLVHDRGDIKKIKHLNKQWQPFGFDASLYNSESNKPIDVLFTGYLLPEKYGNRIDYLHLLLNSSIPDHFKVHAAVATQDSVLVQKIKQRNVTFYGRTSLPQYAQLISQARIVINILQDDGEMPVNPIFFAAGYAKSIQVLSRQEYLNYWDEKNFYFEQVNESDFVSIIEKQLKLNDKKKHLDLNKQFATKFSFQNILKHLLEPALAHD